VQFFSFSEETFSNALSNHYTPIEAIKSKNQFKYFLAYLGESGLKAKTIVIEDEYISKDFLHDYASYYAFCFASYPKFCKRLHFFSKELDLLNVQAIITDIDNVEGDDCYLGFIVVKPIPITVIGYSVLKTYPGNGDFDNRNFWGIRDYKVHFFGKEFVVKSLAFQEQDSVLAACATTAIWSMLNKASVDYHTVLKTPNEITRDADNVSPDGSRLFPNSGLNLLQICKAIYNSGLVSEIKSADYLLKDQNGQPFASYVSVQYLKKILNAYAPIGIPIILVISVPNGGVHGLHAVTVSGYKKSAPKLILPNNETSWLSDNIEKIYAHDDQWGAFARIEFLSEFEFETPWTSFHPKRAPTYVTNIVVPVYPKIRISYEDIEVIVLGLDRILTFFFDDAIRADLVWDVKLEMSQDFKRRIIKSNLEKNEKLKLITKSLPKYLWVACCYIGDFKIFEFTFDATDVRHGMIGVDIVCLLQDADKAFAEFLINNQAILRPLFVHSSGMNYYQFLIETLQKLNRR
jgi:hypothetical protein